MRLIVKDPDAQIDLQVDWSRAFPDGQHVVASQWTISPVEAGGLVVLGHTFSLQGATATVGGGLTGGSYRAGNRVTLSDGQVDERSFTVRVEER